MEVNKVRKSILASLALLVVGLLGSATVLAANAQSERQRTMMAGTDHSSCQNFTDTDGDGICDHQESGGQGQHMNGMSGMMNGMHGTNMMQHSGNCEQTTTTP